MNESGTYTFSGGPPQGVPSCGAVIGGQQYTTSSGKAISSTGDFYNYIVGTGTATGSSTILATLDSDTQGEVDCNYSIAFTAGNGVLIGDCHAYKVVTTGTDTIKTEMSDFPVYGYVNIQPTNAQSGGGVVASVGAFSVTGVVFGEYDAPDVYGAVGPYPQESQVPCVPGPCMG